MNKSILTFIIVTLFFCLINTLSFASEKSVINNNTSSDETIDLEQYSKFFDLPTLAQALYNYDDSYIKSYFLELLNSPFFYSLKLTSSDNSINIIESKKDINPINSYKISQKITKENQVLGNIEIVLNKSSFLLINKSTVDIDIYFAEKTSFYTTILKFPTDKAAYNYDSNVIKDSLSVFLSDSEISRINFINSDEIVNVTVSKNYNLETIDIVSETKYGKITFSYLVRK